MRSRYSALPSVDVLAGERLALPPLAHLKAFQSLPNVMDLLRVNGGACAPLQSELIHEIGQDGEVITGLRSGPGLTPAQEAIHPAAILRRAGSISV
jgi:hypothetical protein